MTKLENFMLAIGTIWIFGFVTSRLGINTIISFPIFLIVGIIFFMVKNNNIYK